MKVYKITDKDGYTRRDQDGETKWGENVTHRITKRGNTLCSDEIFHVYKDPYLAVFMNPSHGNYDSKTLLLWEAKTPKIIADDSTKSGCKIVTTIKRIPKPQITTEQRVEIAICCAMEVYDDEKFQDWAMKWITNQDRTIAAARAAASAAYAAANAASAAYAAANAASAAHAANAAYAAAYAAADAAYAAHAAYAAYAAADAAADMTFNLIDIIHEVLKERNDTT